MFPVLDSTEIERVRRFGTTRSYRSGETLVAVGNISPGLTIILRGRVEVTQTTNRAADILSATRQDHSLANCPAETGRRTGMQHIDSRRVLRSSRLVRHLLG